MVILDTDIIIGALRGEDAAIKRIRELQQKKEPLCMSTVTVFELLRGIQNSSKPEANRARYLEVVETTYPIDFTYIEADIAGKIDAKHQRAGTPIGVLDTMIAATALAIGHPIITRNIKHYEKVPGLKVETW